jgi:hypothetical protein
MNADEQVIQDQWLTNQTLPDAPPFTDDPQVTTRSARKKKRAKTPRVIATKGKATPVKCKIPKPSALPVLPGRSKLDPVATSIRKKTMEAPQKTPTQLEVEEEEKKIKRSLQDLSTLVLIRKKQLPKLATKFCESYDL